MAEGIGLSGAVQQARYELRTVAQGATLLDKVGILRLLSYVHLRIGRTRSLLRRIPEASTGPRVVQLRGGVSLLCRPGDGGVIYESFGARVYAEASSVSRPLRTIVDLGANIGAATVALSQSHPDAAFVCVEPAETTRRLLNANLGLNGVNATVVAAAMGSVSGMYDVIPGRHPGMTRVRPASASGCVKGITLLELLDSENLGVVDFLKIDIEGGERELFESASEWGPRVRTLVTELHDGFSAARAADLLAPAGFRRVILSPGLRHHGLACFTRDSPSKPVS